MITSPGQCQTPSSARNHDAGHAPVEGLQAFKIHGGSTTEVFNVWALSPALQPQELLVNVSDPYIGVCVVGTQGPIGGLQINAEGAWSIEPLDPEALPVFTGSYQGTGDAAIFMRPHLENLDSAMILRVHAVSLGNVTLWAYGTAPALLVNEIGAYAGAVIAPEGTQLLVMSCQGNWSLSG